MVPILTNLVNNLPTDLLKDRETFDRIINKEILNKIPKDKLNLILDKYLPNNLNEEDKLRTVEDLFDNNLNFLTINQMDNFYKQAKIHKFQPDLIKHLNELKLLRKRAYRLEEKKFQCKLLNEIIIKKRLLIQKVLNSINKNHQFNNLQIDSFNKEEVLYKVDKRFSKELDEIDFSNCLVLHDDLNKSNFKCNDKIEDLTKPDINYSIDNDEYLKILKNFKRKVSRNEINEDELKEFTLKNVLDRVLEHSPDLDLFKEQSNNFKRKKKIGNSAKKSISIKKEEEQLNSNQTNKQILISQVKTLTNQIKNKQLENSSKENEHINKINSLNNDEKVPTSFFSLIRDIFYNHSSSEFKITLHKLEDLIRNKLKILEISKPNWQAELTQSALNFLSSTLTPPKMIPLVDYKEKNQQWQWIGDECDDDETLIKLFNDWQDELKKDERKYLIDASQPKPAFYKTDFKVRPSSIEEKLNYREQERKRYSNPDKAFTFLNYNTYKSVVGPVKNFQNATTNLITNSPKIKEKTALLNEHPVYVTLLSLVRDAASRLPNGQGTRADICELLKESSYLREDLSDEKICEIVSGALDRLHHEKDNCVTYDSKDKVWIYLHRYRSEDEFNRLHKTQIEANLAKKNLIKKSSKNNISNLTINKNNQSINNQVKIIEKNKQEKSNLKTNSKNNSKNDNKQIITIESISNQLNNQSNNQLNNQSSNLKLNQTKLIELSHASISQQDSKLNEYPELKNINIKTHQANKSISDELIKDTKIKDLKEKLNNKLTKKTCIKQNILKSTKIKSPEEKTFATTFSNLNSDLIKKYQKRTNKKLKTESDITKDQLNRNEQLNKNEQIKTDTTKSNLTTITKINPNIINNISLPILSTKKEDGNKIIIQNSTNRFNLPTNVITLNAANGSLILTPTGSSINGVNGFPIQVSRRNGNQICILPINTNNLQQTNLTNKSQPVFAKIINTNSSKVVPVQISATNSNVTCSPKF